MERARGVPATGGVQGPRGEGESEAERGPFPAPGPRPGRGGRKKPRGQAGRQAGAPRGWEKAKRTVGARRQTAGRRPRSESRVEARRGRSEGAGGGGGGGEEKGQGGAGLTHSPGASSWGP